MTIEIRKTEEFDRWFSALTNRLAMRRIQVRIDRLQLGNPGDVKPVGEGVSEMRIDYGPGYRVYFLNQERVCIILLAGGDKKSQRRDIRTALDLARRLKERK